MKQLFFIIIILFNIIYVFDKVLNCNLELVRDYDIGK